MDWKEIPKIDAHVHILPEDKRQGFVKYQGEDSTWAKASVKTYIKEMEQYNIKKAILVPANDPYMYYSTRETNEFTSKLVNDYLGKFIGFADLNFNGSYILDKEVSELEYAIKELELSGLKIHPNNLNMDADDLRLVPILRKAAELKIPVIYHSNPCMTGFHDNSAPDKINRMIKVFPDINFITAHMGGMKYLDAWSGCTMVDISFVLTELVDLYGIEQTNRILRMFGEDRLIFGTDYPERNYEEYIKILNKMDFTEREIKKIAYENIELLINLNGDKKFEKVPDDV